MKNMRARSSRRGRPRVVHGDDLLYRFFQDVLARDESLAEKVPRLLIEAAAIWLPLDVYEQWPVLLPWVVRDASCRGNRAKGIPDQWGAPDRYGHLRDDNSLIKALPRGLAVVGPKHGRMHGAVMGREFVASHVWRVVSNGILASRVPLLNSFVPNLVWLPSQVAKLTDREGGIVQATLQAMAFSIYRNARVSLHLEGVVADAWNLIPTPALKVEPIALERLNWFKATPRFFETRRDRLERVLRALEALERRDQLATKVITTRYTEGLPNVGLQSRRSLLQWLRRFRE